ncbi:hypothetical protein BABINDRAFT_170282 [Babjeviella inositovora NRRL Y-12698]|uniref:Uncharacterized protein n=1 Tax=Babjeviella inositovora NRRL Y-12698 TaxID=984486 RepID=A0A1E3QWR0_9ASCO|nr:uncharacterized protein BABINDRAFT_170282 [Babjeviella inositovora NRRL Y-12698]ODQ81512.1 hypothetical protein BABINDRAFT_170282 [Babjeviella inositovora NRRL Y-12698]
MPDEPEPVSLWRYPRNFLKFCQAQWFFIGLAVLIALAHSYPNFARLGGLLKSQYTISYGAVAIIFLISGMSSSTRDLMKNIGHWRAHLTVATMSFIITSAIIYGICTGIARAQNKGIDEWMLVGLIVTATCPTTVALNVVMTQQAHGNVVLTLCEVFIGNLLGAFISPALVQMYTLGMWAFANPAADSSVGDLYRQVMKQLGLSVFVPIFVGQVVQNVFPRQTKWCVSTLKLNKVGSFMLLLIMYASFSTAFYQNAFTSVPTASIIFIVFFNIGIYVFFTILCYFYSRPLFLLWLFPTAPTSDSSKTYSVCYKIFRPFYYNRKDTVSVMLCGAAKTAALGVSLVTSQYGSHNEHLGQLLVPLVLYQSEQVMTAQVLTHFMKKWVHAEEAKTSDEETAVEAKASDGETVDASDSVSNGVRPGTNLTPES